MSARYRMRPLSPGGRVQIVAPSGPFDVADFERGVERLRARYDVRYEPHVTERAGYLAGSDARRRDELLAAIEDPAVDAIVAARGGYGATRLLQWLDPQMLVERPKLLVGFSDITALHALWARAGLASLHAPMVAALGRATPELIARWQRAVEGALPDPIHGLPALSGGRAQGVLLGGNLTVLSALVGTPYLPPLEGAVLFLEDTGEQPYRIDRMLTSLGHAGILQRLAGIALGPFVESAPGPHGVSAQDVLAERLSELDLPVVYGVPAGHIDDNLELPFGARVTLDADRGTLAFDGDYA